MEVLLTALNELQISLELRDGNLDIYDPEEQLTESLLTEIKSHKAELVDMLSELEEGTSNYAPIPKAPFREYYELSAAQERMYFLHLLDDESLAYNVPDIRKLDGPIRLEALQDAFQKLLMRHDILRSTFQLQDDRPVQLIAPVIDFHLPIYQLPERKLAAFFQDFIQPFDLENGPLLRAALVNTEEGGHFLLLDLHHIITDGVSFELLFQEFGALYQGMPLRPVPLQYKDFVAWQRSPTQQERMEQQKQFWLSEFSETPDKLELPTDFDRPTNKTYQGAVDGFKIDAERTTGLREMARESGSTMYMLILSLYYVLLQRLSNQTDIVIGTPVAGRNHADLEGMIGLLMNTLPIRLQQPGTTSFQEVLVAVRQKVLACFEHQDFQYESLVDQLQLNRDTSRNPLFDVLFMYENYAEESNETVERNEAFANPISKFDLTLNASEQGGELLLNFIYSTDLFKPDSIQQLVGYFLQLVDEVLARPSSAVQELKLLKPAQERQLLFHDNKPPSPAKEKTILEIFAQRCKAHPNRLALSYGGRTWTYQELEERSNQLAHFLIEEYQINKGDRVGIMLARDEKLLLALLAILKAGAAYVPLDLDYPLERRKYIERDAQCKVILEETMLTSFFQAPDSYTTKTPTVRIDGEDLIYLIYTSGSTGKPKGVMLEHRNVLAFCHRLDHQLGYASASTVAATTNITFDISVLEIFASLCTGKQIVLFDEADADPETFLQKMRTERVEVLQLTPSRLQQIADFLFVAELPDLKQLIVGGEAFPQLWYEKLRADKKLVVSNVYGPTEATVWSSALTLRGSEKLTIGAPLWQERIYILNEALQVQPTQVVGEICIAGAGIARGYWQRPELSAEKFIPDPFFPEERLYRTGDLGKRLPNGQIVFIGRRDNQVKIRGHRIELGEIEYQILQANASIQQAVAAVKNEALVCYFQATTKIDKVALKEQLLEQLPAYLLPSHFVQLETLPLNSSGKVNRKALPEISGNDLLRQRFVGPRNDTETQLLQIWREVLEVEEISVLDNFFDIGGNSILVVKLFSKMKSTFPSAPRMAELFNSPTIELQARQLGVANTEEEQLIVNEIEF